jgi:hypothetical protein
MEKYSWVLMKRDDWDGIAIVINHLGKPKIFETVFEAVNYADEMELHPVQPVKIII